MVAATSHDSYQTILDRWPSLRHLAVALALPVSTVRSWHTRNSIPAAYWHPVVEQARLLQLRDVTHARLERIAVRQKTQQRANRASRLSQSQPCVPA
jgi:hypothetical protein